MIEIMSKSHIYELKVYVEDVDFGRVFYSRYLQYIERARTELIHEKFGLTLTQLMNEHDVMFVVRKCNIKYRKSAVSLIFVLGRGRPRLVKQRGVPSRPKGPTIPSCGLKN